VLVWENHGTEAMTMMMTVIIVICHVVRTQDCVQHFYGWFSTALQEGLRKWKEKILAGKTVSLALM